MKINDNAFAGCKGLISVEIHKNVTEIGNCAFQECEDLRNVIISKGVRIIGGNAFFGCIKLKEITLPKSVVEIGSTAFYSRENKINIYYEGTREEFYENVTWEDHFTNVSLYFYS